MLPHMIHHRPDDAQSLASAGRRSLGSLAAQNTPQYGRNDTPYARRPAILVECWPPPAGVACGSESSIGGDGTSTHSDCMWVGQLHGTGHVEVGDSYRAGRSTRACHGLALSAPARSPHPAAFWAEEGTDDHEQVTQIHPFVVVHVCAVVPASVTRVAEQRTRHYRYIPARYPTIAV